MDRPRPDDVEDPAPDPDAVDPDAGAVDLEVDEAEPADEERGDEGRGRRSRRRIDARLLMICTLVALIAALLAGLVTRSVLDEDEPESSSGGLTSVTEVPDVPLERLSDGSEVSLADYRGQALVLNFWGSWCAPCIEEMPDLERVHQSLGDDVTFVGVNVRDQEDKALELADETGVTYELVRDTDGALIRDLGITTFPTTVLVRPDGTVVDIIQRKVDADRLCDKINQSLLAGALTECG